MPCQLCAYLLHGGAVSDYPACRDNTGCRRRPSGTACPCQGTGRKMIYAMFDAASLAIITPTELDSLTRRMPHQVADEFRCAWESALAKFREES